MSFVARIDADRWRTHLRAVADTVIGLSGAPVVPVVKGTGYGLGQQLVAAEAAALTDSAIAVGTIFELDSVLSVTPNDVVVLEPFDPRDGVAADAWWHAAKQWDASRIIRTIATSSALIALAQTPGPVRVLLEARSSMHRFGFDEPRLAALLADPEVQSALERGSLLLEGVSLHLPIAEPGSGTSKVSEARRWRAQLADLARAHPALPAVLWVSHLDDAELTAVAMNDVASLRVRIGTRLWLGDRSALHVTGTALAVRPLPAGTHVGYRQRTGPRGGTLVVVSGGTAHGIGLTAPTPAASLRQRVTAAGTGMLDAAGRARSPFTWAGERCWFAEPPHQQHSMIWLAHGAPVPEVGDQIPAEVRFTTTSFDAVILT
jgi:alanine racemase